MIHPRVLFVGDPAAATPWVGIAKKLARECYDLKIASKLYKLGSGVQIRVENIFPVAARFGQGFIKELGGISKAWIEAGAEKIYGFIFHPHSDSAVDGWWFSTEEIEERKVKLTPHYPKHSISGGSNQWNYPYYKANALYKNSVFTRDKDLWCGNQFFTKDGPEVKNKTYWSWWHSPHGDAPFPLVSRVTKEKLTPFISNGAIVYLSKVSPATYSTLTPCIFKNGQLFWSYSDLDITDYTNTITSDDSVIIGGMYPVSDSRLLVVIVSDRARTATLYDINIINSSYWTKTAILTLSSSSIVNSMRWPWRFNSTGTECSTIVQVKQTISGVVYNYTYSIWTISINFDEEDDTYTAVKISDDNYYLEFTRTDTSYVTSSPAYSLDTVNSVVTSGHNQVPVAVSYDNSDNKVVAWLDISGSSLSSSAEQNCSYSLTDVGLPPPPPKSPPELYTRTITENKSWLFSDIGTETIKRILRMTDKDIILCNTTVPTNASYSNTLHHYTQIKDYYGEPPPGYHAYRTENKTCNQKLSGYQLTYPDYGLRVLFLDLRKNIVVTAALNLFEYGTTNIVRYEDSDFTWEFSISGTEPIYPPSGWDDPQWQVVTTHKEDRNYIKINESIVIDDTRTFNSVGGTLTEYEFDLNTSFGDYYATDTFPVPVSGETFLASPYSNSLGISFGIAIDDNKNYVFSYDITERGSSPYDLPVISRETGNYSNIKEFNSQVVNTIPGDNVLLFPLGLA